MSRVIKNDDGVVVVEGTPAAKLVKDSDKFFASKPPERMAGESISQPKRIDPRAINTRSPIQREPDPRAINTRQPTPKDTEQMNDSLSRMSFENLSAEEQAKRDTARREKRMGKREVISERRGGMNVNERPRPHGRPAGGNPNRNEAKEKAESRRKRFFERRRSKKEAERSQEEQEATQGRFITTLGR